MLLAGCSKDADISNSTTLSGNGEKTPLLINATLDTGKGQTRAVDGSFESGDVLYAYVRHMNGASPLEDSYAKKLVTINTNDGANFTSDSYWDDFSLNNNLKEGGHGLQAYYGYCYNGRSNSETPAPALTEDTGVLVWSVLQDQSTETKYKHSDLLKAPQTATVNYAHSSGPSGGHGTLELAFTHAMSQISVTVNAGTGFSPGQDPLRSTAITLNSMFTTTRITGPTGNWENVVGVGNITMYAKECATGATTRDFVAVVAPGTELRVGAQLMNISDVHGNYYTVEITTSEMIAVGKWATENDDIKGDDVKYIETKPGYNYHLTVTVTKSSIQASAILADWTDVSSTGTGNIDFPNNDTNLVMDDAGITKIQDVKVVNISENKFNNGSTFSLFWLKAGDGNTESNGTPKESSTRTNDNYGFITKMTFQDNIGSSDAWTYTPVFYWPNRTDKYYFRALAKFNGTEHVDDGGSGHDADNISLVDDGNNATKDVVVSQSTGPDIVWGTTAHHWGMTAPGKEYHRSYAIAPRTGGVPIVFEHVMSKITFALETTDDDDYKKVNLTGATIAISNLYTQGKIKLDDGSMNFSSYSITTDAIPATTSISGLFVVPQTFADNTIVTIVLPNEPSAGGNATYTIKLKDLTDGSTAITQWEKGKNYSYTIHVDKEQVKVNALVKEWEGVVGSGTATLTW